MGRVGHIGSMLEAGGLEGKAQWLKGLEQGHGMGIRRLTEKEQRINGGSATSGLEVG